MNRPTPQPLAILAVGDPNSELDEEARNAFAESILHNLQNDPQALEAWELARLAAGDEAEERTVQDLTIDDIRGMCREFYEAVESGAVPDPRKPILPFGMTETDDLLFKEISSSIDQRLKDGLFLNNEGAPEADFYVLLVGMLNHAATALGSESMYALHMQQAGVIAMRMFVALLHQRRVPPNPEA